MGVFLAVLPSERTGQCEAQMVLRGSAGAVFHPPEGVLGLAHCPTVCEGSGTLTGQGKTLSAYGKRLGCLYSAFGEIILEFNVSLYCHRLQFTELNFGFYEGEDCCVCDNTCLAYKRLPDRPDVVTEGPETQ